MHMFELYRGLSSLPELAESRRPTIERMVRILASTQAHHIVLRGKPGSGRRTVAHTLFGFGPSLKRQHRFQLNVGELATLLYEPIDTASFFRELSVFAGNHAHGLVLIPTLGLLIEGLEKHEARRLTRFFRDLAESHDIRSVIVADDEEAARLQGVSSGLRTLVTVVDTPSMTDDEVQRIVVERNLSPDLGKKTHELVSRFLPNVGVPGGILQLAANAQSLATQQRTTLSEDHLAQIISEERGLPLSAIRARDLTELQTLAERLSERVVGQPEAIRTVTRVIQRSLAGLRTPDRPIASFLFLGPSGVGKTELAKSLASLLFHSPRSFARIDMSEFSEAHTVQRLIGSPPGYIGYEEGGQLTNPVASEPYSLVLIDEIEKAHPKVFDIFLQLLDDGRLTDGRGKTVDFRHTIVVATSNVGLPEIIKACERGELHDRETFLRTTLFPLLIGYFRPEFLNRFDAIIVFPPLTVSDLVTIGRSQVDALQKKLAERGIQLTVRAETLGRLAERAYQPMFGARPMRRLVADEIETPIAERLIAGTLTATESLTV